MPPIQPEEINLSKGREFNPVLKGLKVLVLVLPIFLILLLVNRVLIGDWVVASILIVMIFTTLVVGSYLRKGKASKVTLFLSVFFMLTITVICTLGSGIHDIVIVAYPLILGFSSILLKIREVVITSILSFISVGWLVVNETYGFYSSESIASGLVSDFISTTTLVLMGGILTYFITRNIMESRHQANSERDKKMLAVQELNHELNEKNLLIKEIHQKVAKSLSYIGLLADHSQSATDAADSEHKNLLRKMISIESAHSILNETSTFQLINLNDYVPTILSRYYLLYGNQIGFQRNNTSEIFVSLDETVSLGFCLLELIHKEGAGEDSINVGIKQEDGQVVLRITKPGASLAPKESSPDPGSVLIDMMVRQLNAQLERTISKGDTSINFCFKPKEVSVE